MESAAGTLWREKWAGVMKATCFDASWQGKVTSKPVEVILKHDNHEMILANFPSMRVADKIDQHQTLFGWQSSCHIETKKGT